MYNRHQNVAHTDNHENEENKPEKEKCVSVKERTKQAKADPNVCEGRKKAKEQWATQRERKE
jgi:hypothetical protein